MTTRYPRMSDFSEARGDATKQDFMDMDPGQSCPRHCPQRPEPGDSPLGAPLSIREVARLIGCSAWTVRQRYVPQGLPHLRSGPAGKLIFFRDQVIRWILQHQQQKGGNRR